MTKCRLFCGKELSQNEKVSYALVTDEKFNVIVFSFKLKLVYVR